MPSSTLRIALFRLICLCSLVAIVQLLLARIFNTFLLVANSVIFLRHFVSAFGPRVSVPGGVDILLIIFLEIPALILPVFVYKTSKVPLERLSPEWVIALTLSTFSLAVLVFLVILRMVDAFRGRWNYLNGRYDIAAGTQWAPQNDNNHGWNFFDLLIEGGHVLFGRSLCRSQFPGESAWVIVGRGCCATVSFVVIGLYAVQVIIIRPLVETDALPIEQFRSFNLTQDFPLRPKDVTYNVVVGRPQRMSSENQNLLGAVNVTSFWHEKPGNVTGTLCEGKNFEPQVWEPGKAKLDVISFQCKSDASDLGIEPDILAMRPDILVVVDFEALGISANSMINRGVNSVQVLVGLTHDTEKVVKNTAPTTLLPGVNLVGIADVFRIRQTYVRPKVSAFGLFESVDTFLTSQMVHVWPDPQASTLPRAPHIATIRIISHFDFSDWDATRDTRQMSVLSGFASVGGVWTLLDGVFMLLFGSYLVRILFGKQLISIIGFAHFFQKTTLQTRCLENYTRLGADLGGEKGFNAFIAEYVVDMDFLRTNGQPNGNGQPDGNGQPNGNVQLDGNGQPDGNVQPNIGNVQPDGDGQPNDNGHNGQPDGNGQHNGDNGQPIGDDGMVARR